MQQHHRAEKQGATAYVPILPLPVTGQVTHLCKQPDLSALQFLQITIIVTVGPPTPMVAGNMKWEIKYICEVDVLTRPDAKSQLIRRDPDAGKDWRQKEKGTTEDEMVGWHHRLNGHEFALEDGEGWRSLACCSPWDHKESDTTEWLNNNNKIFKKCFYRYYPQWYFCET